MEDQTKDIHNFSTSSSHRLPTISGTQAIQNALRKKKGLTTGLPSLDRLLTPLDGPSPSAGIQKGHVTEIYGPPGVGKTTLALQLAVKTALSNEDDSGVVWVNTGSPLIISRLQEVASAFHSPQSQDLPSSPPSQDSMPKVLQTNFCYVEAQILAKILVLFMHPTSDFPPANTSLIIVDDISNPLIASLPRAPKSKATIAPALQEKLAQRISGRRFQITEHLALAMSRLATLRNIAIVVITNASTTHKGGQKAMIKPALSNQAWNASIHTRILLYRDFAPTSSDDELTPQERQEYRLLEVEKLAGKDILRESVPFTTWKGGVREIKRNNDSVERQTESLSSPEILIPTSVPTKRKAIEIADSDEDETFGLGESDDDEIELPPAPLMEPRANEIHGDDDQDDMLLELYENAVKDPL